MKLIRRMKQIWRAWSALCQAEDPEVVAAAVRLNSNTLFDVVTCYDIVKACRREGLDPMEVAQTAQTFHMRWRDALEATREQHAGLPH